MKIAEFTQGFEIEQECLPVRIDSKDGEAVLCIHGYTSYPGIYKPLVPALTKAGFAVSVPRLPGHGTIGKDLLTCRAEDWLRTCIDEYIDLKSRYKKVYVLGQSMGGLIGLILARMFEPAGLILLSPAILVQNKLLPLTPFLSLFIKSYPAKFNEDWSIPVHPRIKEEYWNHRWVAPAAELLKLIRMTRKNLKYITAPVFCLIAGKDKSVKPGAGDYIFNRIQSKDKKLKVLENSVHNIMAGACIAEAVEAVCSWLQSCSET
jgi:carboxylesterase